MESPDPRKLRRPAPSHAAMAPATFSCVAHWLLPALAISIMFALLDSRPIAARSEAAPAQVQLNAHLAKIPRCKAIGYALNQWAAPNRHLDDSKLAMHNNAGVDAAHAGCVDPGAWCEVGCAPVW